MEGTVILAAPVKIFMIQLKALLCLLQAVYDRSGVSVYVHMHIYICTIILPYEYHIHTYIYMQLLLCQSGNTPYDRLQEVLCRSKHDIRVGPLAAKHVLNHGKEKANAGTTFNRFFHTTKTWHTTRPPPHPPVFVHPFFNTKQTSSKKQNESFQPSLFHHMSSAELASFSVLVSGFAQLRLVFGVEVSRLSSCFKLWFSWRMRSYSSLKAERWTKNSLSDAAIGWDLWGGYGPPPKRHLEAGKQSGVRPIRCRVLLVFFFCLLVAVIKKIIVGTDWWHSFFFLYTSL